MFSKRLPGDLNNIFVYSCSAPLKWLQYTKHLPITVERDRNRNPHLSAAERGNFGAPEPHLPYSTFYWLRRLLSVIS